MATVCIGPELCVDQQGRLRSPQSISTGWETLGWWTYAPGWGPGGGGNSAYRVGDLIAIRFVASRSGGPIAAPADGNIADQTIATVTDPRFRPAVSWMFSAASTSHIGSASLDPAGLLKLHTLSANLATGRELAFCAVFAGAADAAPAPCI